MRRPNLDSLQQPADTASRSDWEQALSAFLADSETNRLSEERAARRDAIIHRVTTRHRFRRRLV